MNDKQQPAPEPLWIGYDVNGTKLTIERRPNDIRLRTETRDGHEMLFYLTGEWPQQIATALTLLQQPPAVSERCETQNHVFTCVRCSRQWTVASSDQLECFFSGLCYWCLRETGISQEGVKTALTTGTGEQRCTWAIADGWITTSCGENFVVHDDFDEGDHGMKFCSFCGKSLSGPGSTPAHSERCIKCGHSDGVDNGGLCCFMGEGDPVRAQAIGQASTPWPCGCKCVFPATGATEGQQHVSNVNTKANVDWLKTNAKDYAGQWVAIRNGVFLDSDKSVEALKERVGPTKGTGILVTWACDTPTATAEGPRSNCEPHAYQEHPLYPNYCAFAVGDEDYCKREPDNEIHLSDDIDQHGRRIPFIAPTAAPPVETQDCPSCIAGLGRCMIHETKPSAAAHKEKL